MYANPVPTIIPPAFPKVKDVTDSVLYLSPDNPEEPFVPVRPLVPEEPDVPLPLFPQAVTQIRLSICLEIFQSSWD